MYGLMYHFILSFVWLNFAANLLVFYALIMKTFVFVFIILIILAILIAFIIKFFFLIIFLFIFIFLVTSKSFAV